MGRPASLELTSERESRVFTPKRTKKCQQICTPLNPPSWAYPRRRIDRFRVGCCRTLATQYNSLRLHHCSVKVSNRCFDCFEKGAVGPPPMEFMVDSLSPSPCRHRRRLLWSWQHDKSRFQSHWAHPTGHFGFLCDPIKIHHNTLAHLF